MVASAKFVWGCRLCVRFSEGNLIGSRTKKMGVLLNTKSWLPSSVKNFMANPRGSRTESGDPFSPPTVEMRARTGVSLPMPLRKSAEVRSEISCVMVNLPYAPAALAWTTLHLC